MPQPLDLLIVDGLTWTVSDTDARRTRAYRVVPCHDAQGDEVVKTNTLTCNTADVIDMGNNVWGLQGRLTPHLVNPAAVTARVAVINAALPDA